MVEPAPSRPPVDWTAVRAAYEGHDGTIAEISLRHGVSSKTLQNHALDGGWTRRNQRREIDRGAIIGRMFHLLDRQIIQLEQDMSQIGEKEVMVLGRLASTLEKLIDIDNAEGAEKSRRGPSKEMRDLRTKLAQRIEQLKRA